MHIERHQVRGLVFDNIYQIPIMSTVFKECIFVYRCTSSIAKSDAFCLDWRTGAVFFADVSFIARQYEKQSQQCRRRPKLFVLSTSRYFFWCGFESDHSVNRSLVGSIYWSYVFSVYSGTSFKPSCKYWVSFVSFIIGFWCVALARRGVWPVGSCS